VGRILAGRAAAAGKRLTFETGGKNCIIVLDDADLELTVRAVLWSAFGTTGQRCTSATRIIVQRGIRDQFADRLASAAAALRCGHGTEAESDVGPLINVGAVERVDAVVQDALVGGAVALTGGVRPSGSGAFDPPTVLTDVPREARAEQEEIFGPVTVLVPANDLADAIAIANDTLFGLSAAIFTDSISDAMIAAEEVQTGLFYVNAGTIGAEAHLPSGGVKASGDGRREASAAALDAYSEWRTVYVDYSGRIQRAQIDLATFEPGAIDA
jgi:aldehyde dehydrogenase (NAD+)